MGNRKIPHSATYRHHRVIVVLRFIVLDVDGDERKIAKRHLRAFTPVGIGAF